MGDEGEGPGKGVSEKRVVKFCDLFWVKIQVDALLGSQAGRRQVDEERAKRGAGP